MTIGIKNNKQSIIWRIEGLQEIPPELTMLINPANLDISYTQLVNETRTLGGFILEYWGEALTQLSASGTTAMFYNEGGIDNKDLRISEAYQNFIRLVNIYKNNGKDYYNDRVTLAKNINADRIISFGQVIMTYMEKQYQGYFESFTIKELAEKPFYFEYDFSFKVVKTVGDFIIQSSNFVKE